VNIAVAKRPGVPLDPAMEAFLRFLLSSAGQRVVLEQGIFLPLRAEQVAASLRLPRRSFSSDER
jgi:ABC-type Fe3+ transport system substrate-binding protein